VSIGSYGSGEPELSRVVEVQEEGGGGGFVVVALRGGGAGFHILHEKAATQR
jgi:hypothetical protein